LLEAIMRVFDMIQAKIQDFSNSNGGKKVKKLFRKVWKNVKKITAKIFHYRAVFLALIVVACSLTMAAVSMFLLPAQVGIDLQIDGSYTFMLPKLLAVLFPVLITLISLVFVLISKRTLYPWLISLFTLALPAVILLTNIFPF
jgi:hypothetical protein